MIERDPQLEGAHALLELIVYCEVSVDAVVFGDELNERHANVAQNQVVAARLDILIHDCVLRLDVIVCEALVDVIAIGLTSSGFLNFLLLRFYDVVSDFEDSSLVLQILEDLGVHLQVQFEDLAEHWVQAVEQHPRLISREISKRRLNSIAASRFLRLSSCIEL